MSSHPYTAAIKQKYAGMSDEELLLLAKKEGLDLTAEAVTLLREELGRRKIGADIMAELDREIIVRYGLKIKQSEEDVHADLYNKAWKFAFNSKANGQTDNETYSGLIQTGINSEYAYYILNSIKDKAEALAKDSLSAAQAGLVILIIGIFLVYYTFKLGHFQAAAVFVPVTGMLRIVTATVTKSKYQTIVDNIKSERDQQDVEQG